MCFSRGKTKEDWCQRYRKAKDEDNGNQCGKTSDEKVIHDYSSDQQRSSSKNAFTGLASTEASGSLFSFGVVCKDGSTSSVSLFGFGLSNRNNPSVSALLDLPLSRRVKVVGFLQSRRFPQRQEKRTRKLPSQLSRFCLNISMEDGESVVQQSMK